MSRVLGCTLRSFGPRLFSALGEFLFPDGRVSSVSLVFLGGVGPAVSPMVGLPCVDAAAPRAGSGRCSGVPGGWFPVVALLPPGAPSLFLLLPRLRGWSWWRFPRGPAAPSTVVRSGRLSTRPPLVSRATLGGLTGRTGSALPMLLLPRRCGWSRRRFPCGPAAPSTAVRPGRLSTRPPFLSWTTPGGPTGRTGSALPMLLLPRGSGPTGPPLTPSPRPSLG